MGGQQKLSSHNPSNCTTPKVLKIYIYKSPDMAYRVTWGDQLTLREKGIMFGWSRRHRIFIQSIQTEKHSKHSWQQTKVNKQYQIMDSCVLHQSMDTPANRCTLLKIVVLRKRSYRVWSVTQQLVHKSVNKDNEATSWIQSCLLISTHHLCDLQFCWLCT